MPDDVGGQPFPDGEEPEYSHHTGADDAFASVVFDEDFVRAAVVHEPTAAERTAAAAQSRAEAERRRPDEGHGRREHPDSDDEFDEDDPEDVLHADGLHEDDGFFDGPELRDGEDDGEFWEYRDYRRRYPGLDGGGDPRGYPHGYGTFGPSGPFGPPDMLGPTGDPAFGRPFPPARPGPPSAGAGLPYAAGHPSGHGRYGGHGNELYGRDGLADAGDAEHGADHRYGQRRRGHRPSAPRRGRRFGAREGAAPPRGASVRWQRPVAWVLAVVMGIGMVALALGAVYRGGAGQRQDPAPPPSTADTDASQGTGAEGDLPAGPPSGELVSPVVTEAPYPTAPSEGDEAVAHVPGAPAAPAGSGRG